MKNFKTVTMKTVRFNFAAAFSTMLIFCLSITAYSQNEVLVLTKKKSGKEKTIEQGKRIKIWTNTGKTYKGPFAIKDDSLIIADKAAVSINDVEMISRKSTGKKVLGGSLALGGAFVGAGFISLTSTLIDTGGWSALLIPVSVTLATGGVLIATTGVILLTTGKKYKEKKWDFEIQKTGP